MLTLICVVRQPFPGFGDRVLSEVKRLAPQKDVKLKIYAPPERKVRLVDDSKRTRYSSHLFVVVLDMDWRQYSGGSEHIQEGQ
jgi:hypothetical protein